MRQTNRILIAAFTLIILLSGVLIDCTGPKEDTNPVTTTTVILIRHVERDNFFVVTKQGHERARALIDAVADIGLTAIYSPDLQRNLDTATPLAKHLRMEITLIPRFSKVTIHQLLREILIKHRGEVILLVSNGAGNLRTLHRRLGGIGGGPHSYRDLFIYTIPPNGPAKVTRSRYGS